MIVINVNSGSKKNIEAVLSNFAPSIFCLNVGGEMIWFNSVENFIQMIKFPEKDPDRLLASMSEPKQAKKIGSGAKNDFVYWGKNEYVYGGTEHQIMIERAIRAKFNQNPVYMKALISTYPQKITHELGQIENPRTSLPKDTFCEILCRIREENLNKN